MSDGTGISKALIQRQRTMAGHSGKDSGEFGALTGKPVPLLFDDSLYVQVLTEKTTIPPTSGHDKKSKRTEVSDRPSQRNA